MKIVVYNEQTLREAFTKLREEFREHHRIIVSSKDAKDRSLEQNACFHAFMQEVSAWFGDRTPLEAKTEAKAYCGIPILLAEDDEFREAYNRSVAKITDPEDRMAAIELLPVTSRMTTKQMSQFLERVQAFYGKAGCMLEFPESDT